MHSCENLVWAGSALNPSLDAILGEDIVSVNMSFFIQFIILVLQKSKELVFV